MREDKEYLAGFSLKSKVDRVIWISCKSEFIAKFKIGGRDTFERERDSQGHPWIILIRDGERLAKAYSKSSHSTVPAHARVRHKPHLHEQEKLLDIEADVQVWDPPFSYNIDIRKFLEASIPELCSMEKNSFLENLADVASKQKKSKDWFTNGR